VLVDGRGVARECLLGLVQGPARRLRAGGAVDVAHADPFVPALELVERCLLLVEFDEREPCDLELVVDLTEKLRALARELAVLGIAGVVPRLDKPVLVVDVDARGAEDGHVASEVVEKLAQPVDHAGERVGIGDGHDGLLDVQRAGASQLAPHRDAGA